MSSQQREATQTKAEPPTRQTELPMRFAAGACAEAEGRGSGIESKEDSDMEQKNQPFLTCLKSITGYILELQTQFRKMIYVSAIHRSH